MVASNRHEQRRLKTRQKLIEAAKAMFSEKGFNDTTILDITNAADVSKRTFYVHFPEGKDEILAELARFSVDEVVAEIRQTEAEREDMTLRASMELSMAIVFQWMAAHPALAQIVFGPDAEPTLRAMIVDYVAAVFREEMVRDECPYNADAGVPIEIVAQIKSAALAQLVYWSLTRPHHHSPEDFARFMTAVFFDPLANFYPEDVRQEIG